MSQNTRPSNRRRGAKKASAGGGNAVYRLGLIGALVWFWHSPDVSTGGRPLRGLLVDAAATAVTAVRRAAVAIRPLETVEQLQDACTVLDRVWDVPPGRPSKIQPHLLRALGHGGNYVVGAYQPGETMVGASVAFFTAPLGSAMQSHITGVLPGKAGSGIGAALKWHQRQWALERGLTKITWTYDPLIARNSYFNLTRLGARPDSYFVDFYGVMDDGQNRGQPTDRMQVCWDLAAASTGEAERAVLQGRAAGGGPDVGWWIGAGAVTLLSAGPAGEPVRGPLVDPTVTSAVIGIPADIEQIRRTDPPLALSWRFALRSTLASVMADGAWKVTGFARSGWYLVERPSPGRGMMGRAGR